MAVVRICETGMPNFAPWYRRQDYPLMREIMDDGETLPLSFDEWEKNAECEQAAAKREGVSILPVFLDPDEFFTFCDLQERATLIDEQIRAAYSHFEKTVEQLKNEHNVRVADLKSGLTMIAKFMEFEQRYFRSDSPPVQSSALVTLADLFMHRLNEVGLRWGASDRAYPTAVPTMSQAIKLRRVV